MSVSLGDLLTEGLGVLRTGGGDSPRLDAELLLANCLGLSRVTITAHPETPVPVSRAHAFRDLVGRRAGGEPLAHLTGEREFYGHLFEVTPDVLIPRPDSELLVDRALEWLAARAATDTGTTEPVRVLDLGTGSGCLAVTLALECPHRIDLTASDLSAAALAVARGNARRYGLEERIAWCEGDLLAPIRSPVDLMVSNPPYVAADDARLAPDVAAHEPALALRDVHDGDGLGFYRRLAAEAPPCLAPGGALLLEVGEDQAGAVGELCTDTGWVVSETHRDLAGIDRVVLLTRAA